MKTSLKIIAAILGLLILLAVGLNLYFTNERLQKLIIPQVNEALGRPVDVEEMSLTFFSTFPRPGVSISGLMIPGETETDTLVSMDELHVAVEFFSLMGDQLSIAELEMVSPKFTYTVYPDSSTNIDFLAEGGEAETDTSAGMAVAIPSFQIADGEFGYYDSTSNTAVRLEDLNADISFSYAEDISSTIDLQLGGLTASVNDTAYISNLPLSLQQTSTVDLENELIKLEEGVFSIRGLALNLTGSVSNWSQTPQVDLAFTSSSDNLKELLELAPVQYEQYTEKLESRGTLAIDGTVKGAIGSEELPAFNLTLKVTDGYLKNPDLPEPIQDIQLSAKASNEQLTVEQFTAQAGKNSISASSYLADPLEETGRFTADVRANVDLATINEFYDVSQLDIEKMSGQLNIDARAEGDRSAPREASFEGLARLSDGMLKFADVPKPIENISINAEGNQASVSISQMQLQAANNTFSAKGVVNHLLNEDQRSIDLSTELRFDLATIKDFYPINEDTLSMRGMLTANASLKGKADRIEQAIQQGSIHLDNGYISHKSLGKPLENITFESRLDGPVLNISQASFETGNNELSATGSIQNYLSENRSVDLQLKGNADLNQIPFYYDLEPSITTLTGQADLNLRVRGPVASPGEMKFDGQMTVNNVTMEGEAIVQPVSNLSGKLTLSPQLARLGALGFKIGSSDIALEGSLADYMAYLEEPKNRKVTPQLYGSYKSRLLNLDELLDWEDTTTTPTPIHLPDLNSSVNAEISKMIVTGVPMSNLRAKAGTTPQQIKLQNGTVQLFNGEASGAFTWDVSQANRTKITFNGSLDRLQADAFFEEYPVLGEQSKFHEYVSGSFSAKVKYFSELNAYLEPQLPTTNMSGSFGMTKSRLKEHPLQNRLASLLNANELKNLVLDEWESTFTLDDNILTFKKLKLTSGDIGLELNGTQRMITGDINYQLKLFLPGRFKDDIASVITMQAAEALTRKNGTMMVPLRVTGTHSNPQVSADKEVIAPIVKEYLQDKAGNVLKKLFDRK